MLMKITKKQLFLKILGALFGVFGFCVILYMLILPLYPFLKNKKILELTPNEQKKVAEQKIKKIINFLPNSSNAPTALHKAQNNIQKFNQPISSVQQNKNNYLIIPKINVNIPIIESRDPAYGLNHGAWHMPESSTPPNGGNTVITGHRFKYLPPSNLTFYLFHKLNPGDIIAIIWDNKAYYYTIKKIKTIPKNDTSILAKSQKPILTLFTCDPIYSQKNRLVVIATLNNK